MPYPVILLITSMIMMPSSEIKVSGIENSERHPFYISVCNIDHNADTRALEITFKIFTDDLEQALEAQGTGRLNLGGENESEDAEKYIGRYLALHFEIIADGQLLQGEFLGRETELDVTWCYVEITDVPSLKTITVTNTLLVEEFEGQTNMVHIKVGDQKKSLLLTEAVEKDTVEF